MGADLGHHVIHKDLCTHTAQFSLPALAGQLPTSASQMRIAQAGRKMNWPAAKDSSNPHYHPGTQFMSMLARPT